MILRTSKEQEIVGHMEHVLRQHGYWPYLATMNTSSYKNKACGLVVSLIRTGNTIRPFEAMISDIPAGEGYTFNPEGFKVKL